MARILITSGPTRQYLDPVRYLTNASSGRMGAALAAAALAAGHQAVIVTGPVDVVYPSGAEVYPVVSTDEMLAECLRLFPGCDGLIAAAAPCDYRPESVARHKIRKTAGPLQLRLVETPDIVAALAQIKTRQWIVAFALETEDAHLRAMQKLERKSCGLIVVNGPETIHAPTARIEILDPSGAVAASLSGTKEEVSRGIISVIGSSLINPRSR
jgi:phosphopantothenoylcysteine decarboxylase / phosphopantothenate---cysteine ligase